MRQRRELVECSFQHVLDRSIQRQTHARGSEKAQDSYLRVISVSTLPAALPHAGSRHPNAVFRLADICSAI